MSEIIRDAVIRLRLETQKAKLESPEISQATRAYVEQAKAAEVTQRQTRENISLTKEHTRTIADFGVHSARSFKDGLEGTIQFARGFALMTASGEEDTRKLLEAFAKIEAATALVRGGANLAKFANSFGPIGIAVAAVSAAVGVGVVAWQRYTNRLEEARKKTEEARKETEKLGLAARDSSEKLGLLLGEQSIGSALSPETKQNRIQTELDRLRRRQYIVETQIEAADKGPPNLERDKSLRQRQLENAQSQRDLLREQWQAHDELMTQANDILKGQREGFVGMGAYAGVPGFGSLAVTGAAMAFGGQQTGMQSRQKQVLDETESFIDVFVGIMRGAQRKLAEIDAELKRQEAANPK